MFLVHVRQPKVQHTHASIAKTNDAAILVLKGGHRV